MNFKMIKYVLGWIMLFEGAFLLIPLVTAIVCSESAVYAVLITMGICVAAGAVCTATLKPQKKELFAREGFVITALGWIALSVLGSLPFVFSGAVPSFIDALFESTSGFTSTGASVLSDVESFPKSLLIWRSFSHWIGGMGVLVFVMAILPLSGAQNMNMLKAESPGPEVNKLVPRVRNSALILYGIYIVMTAVQLVLLLLGGMSFFDAVNTAFSTAGTGGFAVKNDGLNGYSPYIQVVVTVFMLLFSVNFNVYYLLLCFKLKKAFNLELKVFVAIVLASIVIVTINAYSAFSGVSEALRHSSFTVASIISTTGFTTIGLDGLPDLSRTLLVLLMIIGSCAGSTGGGIKVSRVIILFKQTRQEISRLVHPKQVKRITLDGQPIEGESVSGVNAFMLAYAAIFALSLFIVSLDGYDFTTGFISVVTTINNVGVSFGTGFAGFSWYSKLSLIFNMLAGRLELFPLLILFMPSTWKR